MLSWVGRWETGNIGKVSQLCEYKILGVWLLHVACFRLDLKQKKLSQPNGSFLPRSMWAAPAVISPLKGVALTRYKTCQGRKGKLVICGVLSVGTRVPQQGHVGSWLGTG